MPEDGQLGLMSEWVPYSRDCSSLVWNKLHFCCIHIISCKWLSTHWEKNASGWSCQGPKWTYTDFIVISTYCHLGLLQQHSGHNSPILE